jgi:type I restriction enzyme S subunit
MVEWKKLGDVCGIFDGTHQTPKYTDSGIKFVSVENINGLYNSNKFISVEDFNANYKTKPQRNDVLMTRIGDVGSCAIVDKDEPLAYYVSLALLRPNSNVISGYIKYILESRIGKVELRKRTLHTAVPIKINLSDVGKVCIPIPSLSEQNRIVGILDAFTASIENLKEQITQRRKQFEHYRDQLLDLEGKEDDIVSLGDVCEMIKGNGVQKVDFVEEGIGCIHYGQIYTHYGSFTYTTNKFVSKETFEKARKASKGDIVMTDTSENVEDICKSVAYLGDEDIAVSNHALILKHKQNPKFLSYSTLTKSFFNQKRKVVVGVKVSGIKPEHLAQIRIYLPSIKEQSRLVSILDTFEASIRNLEEQLAQRQKQYEYYRNKLLTFE